MLNDRKAQAPSKVTVICVGNEFRRDDGVGFVVAKLLRTSGHEYLDVMEATGEGATLIELWRDAEAAVIVDAVCSGADPGTVYHIDVHGQQVPSALFRYSTHAFGVAQAVELARTLHKLPPKLVIYGIEGADFGDGVGLTPEVEEAAEHVTRSVVAFARLATGQGLQEEPNGEEKEEEEVYSHA